jgi:hypothetical protein
MTPTRADVWEQNFVACKNHEDRRCLRSRYVRRRERLCAWCAKRPADDRRPEGRLSELLPNKTGHTGRLN